MLLSGETVSFTVNQILALYKRTLMLPCNFGPSLSLAAGTLLGLRQSSANHVLTITDTPTITAGTFTVTGVNPLNGLSVTSDAIAYNANNATVQTALEAIYGTGNVVVAGSGLPGNDTTLTFQGDLAGMPVDTPTIDNTSLTGGSLAVAVTTIGRSAFTFDAYSTLKLANPTAAPNPSGTGSGGGFAAGAYGVTYTLVTAEGETAESPVDTVALTADQQLRIAAIGSLSTRVTAVNVYVNGYKIGSITPSAGTAAQTDFTLSTLTGTQAPKYNSTGNFKAILSQAISTNTRGRVTKGAQTATYNLDEGDLTFACEFGGVYRASELVGLDADALESVHGRILSGTISDGLILIPIC